MTSTNVWAAEAVVIGGGPAGMMAAITAAERGARVLLLEHEARCGRKLRITGKGRCNVCNNTDAKTVMKAVNGNPKFLYSSLNALPPAAVMAFFENSGVPLKTERGNRVFPASDRAEDVAEALLRRMERCGVRVLRGEARRILTENDGVRAVKTAEEEIPCRSVLIATGGLSYPRTGSDGSGLRMAEALGHRIVAPRPSLVPLVSDDPDCAEMQGFSLRNVTLTAFDGAGSVLFSELGELLFTHFGLSGPLVLSASAHLRDFEHERYRLEIDLKPGLDEKQLDARLLRDFAEFKNRDFRNALDKLAGRSMIPVLLRRSGIPEDTKVHSITREQRRGLVRLFKHFEVSVTGARPIEEAIVTAGGVDVKQVDPRTMESKLVRGLHFAGEVLDLDAYTGGYNLQIAWSTGFVAGMNL
ncbi:MAG: NAD(P)/FAD-dependent oxidoreductase [Oscillospiraceae bacterium]|nr:NAD(P)/FAD-dependent oxidoreductase [Oscillospiraceae bacterium]